MLMNLQGDVNFNLTNRYDYSFMSKSILVAQSDWRQDETMGI
jgi:hypothetical protein